MVHLSIGVEPTRGLGKEPAEDEDEAGKHHLKPDGKGPRYVSSHAETTTACSTSDDGTDGPVLLVKVTSESRQFTHQKTL